MTDKFKSNSVEAKNDSNNITIKASNLQELAGLTINITNLTVVKNLQEINESINSCNMKYKKLLESHAKSIEKLATEFDEFDKGLSDTMVVADS